MVLGINSTSKSNVVFFSITTDYKHIQSKANGYYTSSFQNHLHICLVDRQHHHLSTLTFLNAMSNLRNRVQLIGNAGSDPEIKTLESGKKLAALTLATNEVYYKDNGDKVEQTEWHRITAWGKTAEILEKYVTKGKELAIDGKLTHRSYEDKNGDKKFITEIQVGEICLL
jgi:single-strand DNA-binding protein